MSDALRDEMISAGRMDIGFPENTEIALKQLLELEQQKKVIETAIKQRKEYLVSQIPIPDADVASLGTQKVCEGDVEHTKFASESTSWAKAFTDFNSQVRQFIPTTKYADVDALVEKVKTLHKSTSFTSKFDYTDDYKARQANEQLFGEE